MGTLLLLLADTAQQKGVSIVTYCVNFLLSFVASVVASYACKWLERHRKDKEQ